MGEYGARARGSWLRERHTVNTHSEARRNADIPARLKIASRLVSCVQRISWNRNFACSWSVCLNGPIWNFAHSYWHSLSIGGLENRGIVFVSRIRQKEIHPLELWVILYGNSNAHWLFKMPSNLFSGAPNREKSGKIQGNHKLESLIEVYFALLQNRSPRHRIWLDDGRSET